MRYRPVNSFLCYIVLLFFLSCSSEKPADLGTKKTAGADSKSASEQFQPFVSSKTEPYALAITPLNASRNSILQVIAQGFKVSDAKIEWLLNGYLTSGGSSPQFDARETKKGDKIQVKAIIQGKELMSNTIEIKNASPEITRVKILPEIFKPGDALSVEVSGKDADGDEVTISYEWTKNGEPAGNGKRLEVPIKRGDKISIRITPFDGEVNGQAVILNREIKNMPPMIIEDNKFHFDGKFFSYQIKAVDPDGDTLTYTFKQAPEGMVIDKAGLITWKVSEKDKSRHSVAVQVTDGQGGEASYAFNVTPGSQ